MLGLFCILKSKMLVFIHLVWNEVKVNLLMNTMNNLVPETDNTLTANFSLKLKALVGSLFTFII